MVDLVTENRELRLRYMAIKEDLSEIVKRVENSSISRQTKEFILIKINKKKHEHSL
jgi:regulator of replication initiation timing